MVHPNDIENVQFTENLENSFARHCSMAVDEQATNLLNLSIISNLTLSDFEIVTSDELNNDYWRKCCEQYNGVICHTNKTMSKMKIIESCGNLINCININNERNGIFEIKNSLADSTKQISTNNSGEMLAAHTFNQINDEHTTDECFCDSSAYNKVASINSNVNSSTETSLIYNLKNGCNESQKSKMSLSTIIENFKSGNSAAPNYNHIHQMIDSIQKLTQFVSKKVFGTIFNHNNEIANKSQNMISMNKCTSEKHEIEIKNRKFDTFNEYHLTELNTIECKRLLIQLFEITLGVMLCEYKDRKAGTNIYILIHMILF